MNYLALHGIQPAILNQFIMVPFALMFEIIRLSFNIFPYKLPLLLFSVKHNIHSFIAEHYNSCIISF